MADLKGETYEANLLPESKEIKYYAPHSYAGVDGVGSYASTQPILVKSDISTEFGLPLRNGSFEMDAKKTQGNHLNAAEDGTHDSQNRTESSCSNSLPVVLPFSFLNHSYQVTSKEAYSLRNSGVSIDSSHSKAFGRSLEEPVTASSDRSAGTVCKSSVCSGNSDNLNCTSKTVENMRSCGEHDNLPMSHSAERMIRSEASQEGDNILAVKGKPLEMNPEVMDKKKGDFWVNESSESSMTKDTFLAGFDLNEDINANGMDDCIQPVVATISSHSVIHVVAKAGILSGRPMIPLKFEGGRGWNGSSETSAFHPATLSKNLDRKTCSRTHGPKDRQDFTGIDLNVAAVDDTAANGLPMEYDGISSPPTLQDSHSEVNSKRAKIDLNFLCDAAAESTQRSPLENLPLIDLNLNANTSKGVKSNNVHWLGQDFQSMGNKTLDSANLGKRDFTFTRHDYLADLSTMQHVTNNSHTLVAVPNILQPVELMHRVASLQPNLPLISRTLPPYIYPSEGPFHFGSIDSQQSTIPFSGIIPYARYSHEHGIFPAEVLNPSTVHTSFGTPPLLQVFHEQNTSNIAASAPKFAVKIEDNLSSSGSKMDEARTFSFIAKDSAMGEHVHQEAWYASSMKRKEPEGGLGCYRLGYKQVT